MKCYHPSSACYCLTKVAVCPTGKVFSTQEVSVGKAAVTEVQYQLEGHLVLDEVGMRVGQPAAPPPSLVLWSGGGALKAPVAASLFFMPSQAGGG